MARPQQKLAEQIAARIESDIIAMGWPVGQLIGSEPSLMAKYGVSRAVLREAIRLIEHHFVGRMRPGPNGGLLVTKPDSEVVARAISLYLSFAKVGRDQLLEIRGEIEGFAAELAAQRATDQERVQLREFMGAELHRLEDSWLEAKEFHLRVAALAHNPTVDLLVRCLADLTEGETTPAEERHEVASNTHAVHTKIADAIISGDASMARYRMSRHIRAISPWLTRHAEQE